MDDIERIPREIFEESNLQLEERLLNYLVAAAHHSQNKGPWVQATSSAFAAKLLETALKEHAKALIQSAEASEKHAASLTIATWALVGATVALVIVSLLSIMGFISN